jgi:hypothetical protein
MKNTVKISHQTNILILNQNEVYFSALLLFKKGMKQSSDFLNFNGKTFFKVLNKGGAINDSPSISKAA